ncbi:MAG: hypothetical protein M2R45_00021 [Verrucomicrobia subdivision 3 bacterium]|nr:hypothetical protein [Limisphaerales bacterium]MCS1412520.1 hypothetical protein [Limisphaerales bacterium]
MQSSATYPNKSDVPKANPTTRIKKEPKTCPLPEKVAGKWPELRLGPQPDPLCQREKH